MLTPVTFSSEKEGATPLPDYIDNDELIYIRDTLLNILIQERNQSIGKSKFIQNNSEEDDNITSSSSYPPARFLQQTLEHIDSSLNKSQQIEKWLADVKSSPECVIDLSNSFCFC